MTIRRRKVIAVIVAAILGGTGTAGARSSRADERLDELFGDGRHPGRGKGNAHGPDLGVEEYTLTVEVVDVNTGELIEVDTWVSIYTTDGEYVAEHRVEDGLAVFELEAGEYRVQAHDATGGWIETETVTVDGDTTLTLEVDPRGDIP